MNRIQAVLWDMDGVLIDSERLVQKAFVEVANSMNLMERPAQRYLETIGFNRASTVKWYLQFVESQAEAESLYSAVNEVYVSMAKTELTLKPGVCEALTFVDSLDIPQMVVTSTRTQLALSKLTQFELLPFFKHVIGGDQVRQGKPNPEPYLKGVEHLGMPANCTLVIEDSENGVKSGASAGCQVLHVPDLIPTKPEWHPMLAGSIESLEHLPNWLTKV
ncbi:HAD family phosphatase [Reinekea forsetii]|nr:HAD family phosphatase [Reinekea forsetii]